MPLIVPSDLKSVSLIFWFLELYSLVVLKVRFDLTLDLVNAI